MSMAIQAALKPYVRVAVAALVCEDAAPAVMSYIDHMHPDITPQGADTPEIMQLSYIVGPHVSLALLWHRAPQFHAARWRAGSGS